MLVRAPEQTVSEFRRSVARAVIAVDPASAADRHQKATQARTIERMPQPDGDGVLLGHHARLHQPRRVGRPDRRRESRTGRPRAGRPARRRHRRAAPRRPGARHAAQRRRRPRRPAAHQDRHRHRPSDRGTAPRPAPERPAGAEVLLRRRAVRGGGDRPGDPARPRGPPRRDPRLRTHPRPDGPARWPPTGTGSGGPSTPPPASCWTAAPSLPALRQARAFVADRDRVCGFPGCNRPAEQCDCDHIVTFAHHGQTIRINLGPLCRQHHNAKTHGPWKLRYDPDTGTKTWTSPLGKTYTKSHRPTPDLSRRSTGEPSRSVAPLHEHPAVPFHVLDAIQEAAFRAGLDFRQQ